MAEGQKAIAEERKTGGLLTAEHVRKYFGINDASEAMLNIINGEADSVVRYAYIQNLTTASNIYRDSGATLGVFMHASNFATQIITGEAPAVAFKRVFPDKYRELIKEGKDSTDVAKIAALYRNTKLVVDLLEQSYIPAHLMYQDVFHKGIHRLARLMSTAESEMVRFKAADSIVNNLRAPEKFRVELDIGVKSGGIIEELKATTLKLAKQQKKLLQQGASIHDLAEADIIEITAAVETEVPTQ